MHDRWITDRVPSKVFPAYTRGNAGEVLPDPVSPLGWSLMWQEGIIKGCRDGFIEFGLVDWSEFETPNDPECFGMYGGYFYNPLSLVRLMGARIPGGSPEAIDAAYFDPRPDVPPYVREPWHESAKHAEKLGNTFGWVMTTDAHTQVDLDHDQVEKLRADRPNLSGLHDSALLARARSIVPMLQQMFETSIHSSLGASVGPGALAALCGALGVPEYHIALLGGIEVDSAKPSFAMWDLSRIARNASEVSAEFERGMDNLLDRIAALGTPAAKQFITAYHDFVYRYGSRGPNEWDLYAKTWETHPELALGAIDRMRVSGDEKSPYTRHAAAVAERDRLAAEMRRLLAGDAEQLGTFELAMKSSAIFLASRERYKTNLIKAIGEIRMALREFARRRVERKELDSVEQLYMLTAAELDGFRHEPSAYINTLRDREREFAELGLLEPPFIVNATVKPLSQWERKGTQTVEVAAAGDVLTGTAGSGGIAEGRARVLLDPSDPFALEPGEILIAPNTDPSWTPLFVPSAAVVVNVGAMGTHAMIVSRELGIPCVVSVRDATARIPNGARVRVNGAAGTVEILGD